jgi:hypothetical protein
MCRSAAEPGSTKALDLHDQGAVLIHVLSIFPAQTRPQELIRELSEGSTEFSAQDGLERAVRDLLGVGPLFRCDESLLPTRVALRFHEIVEAGV